jgi:hypothetical protein
MNNTINKSNIFLSNNIHLINKINELFNQGYAFLDNNGEKETFQKFIISSSEYDYKIGTLRSYAADLSRLKNNKRKIFFLGILLLFLKQKRKNLTQFIDDKIDEIEKILNEIQDENKNGNKKGE